jgi:hypothetical protein
LTTEYDELLPAPVAVKGHWNSVRLGSFRGCGSNQFLPEPQRLAQCKRSTGAWCKTCNPNPGWGNPLLRELWIDGHFSRVLVHNILQVFVELLLIYLSANCQPFVETLWNSGALTLGKDCRTVGSVLAMIGLSIFELFQLCQRAVRVPWSGRRGHSHPSRPGATGQQDALLGRFRVSHKCRFFQQTKKLWWPTLTLSTFIYFVGVNIYI